jgi:hypothetical protein
MGTFSVHVFVKVDLTPHFQNGVLSAAANEQANADIIASLGLDKQSSKECWSSGMLVPRNACPTDTWLPQIR